MNPEIELRQLFQTTQQNISQYIVNIYEESELTLTATVKKYLTVRQEGKRKVKRLLDYYNLDMMDQYRLILFTTDKLKMQNIINSVIPLLDCVVTDWTSKEARAVYGELKGWTQEESARKCPPDKKTGKIPTRQAISLSLDRAHWKIVKPVLKNIRNSLL